MLWMFLPITFLCSAVLLSIRQKWRMEKAGSDTQKWNATSSSSGDAHPGASTSRGKIPILWGVTINNASVWMWGTQLKGICLSQMPVTTFIPGTCRARAGERVCGEVERMQYLHTSHHVLFISHLDVFIYPMPPRKSALIQKESTQDFKVAYATGVFIVPSYSV